MVGLPSSLGLGSICCFLAGGGAKKASRVRGRFDIWFNLTGMGVSCFDSSTDGTTSFIRDWCVVCDLALTKSRRVV